jgi:hypothetical protein
MSEASVCALSLSRRSILLRRFSGTLNFAKPPGATRPEGSAFRAQETFQPNLDSSADAENDLALATAQRIV